MNSINWKKVLNEDSELSSVNSLYYCTVDDIECIVVITDSFLPLEERELLESRLQSICEGIYVFETSADNLNLGEPLLLCTRK